MSILKRLILSFQQEKMMDFDYCEKYIRVYQTPMTVLKKANSYSVDILRLIKNQ